MKSNIPSGITLLERQTVAGILRIVQLDGNSIGTVTDTGTGFLASGRRKEVPTQELAIRQLVESHLAATKRHVARCEAVLNALPKE